MKVKELMERLQEQDPEADVEIAEPGSIFSFPLTDLLMDEASVCLKARAIS
jgi:hypothetical protein